MITLLILRKKSERKVMISVPASGHELFLKYKSMNYNSVTISPPASVAAESWMWLLRVLAHV